MSSATQEIPQNQWLNVANDVSRAYRGWDATIEVLERDVGDQPEAKALPFQGLSYEAKGGSAAGDIIVEAGDAEPAYEALRVHQPRALRLIASVPGMQADIQIESADGAMTLVHLRNRPGLPRA